MKKIIRPSIYLFFILSSYNLVAQIESIELRSGVHSTGVSPIEDTLFNYCNDINSSTGLAFNVALFEGAFFRIGLDFGSYSYRPKFPEGLRWPSQFDENGGFDPTIPGPTIPQLKFNYIAIPLSIGFTIIESFIDLRLLAGLKICRAFNISEPYGRVTRDLLSSIIEEAKTEFVMANVGFELSKKINEQFTLFILPEYLAEPNSQKRGIRFQEGEKKVAWGLNLGLRYEFKTVKASGL